MVRRPSFSRNSSARVVEAIGMVRILGSVWSAGGRSGYVILPQVGGERTAGLLQSGPGMSIEVERSRLTVAELAARFRASSSR